MTPSQETAELAVTQSDRILAARFLPARDYEKVLAGDFDYLSTVRDIARHRIASLSASPPVNDAGIRKALEEAVEVLEHVGYDGTDFDLSVNAAIVKGKVALTDSAQQPAPAGDAEPFAYMLRDSAGNVFWDEDMCVWTHREDAEEVAEEMGGYEVFGIIPATPPSVPAQQGEGWQDIATAPKDGTWFLAYDEIDGAHYAASWDGDENWRAHCGQHVTETPTPTHWMPLPANPPSQEKKGEEE